LYYFLAYPHSDRELAAADYKGICDEELAQTSFNAIESRVLKKSLGAPKLIHRHTRSHRMCRACTASHTSQDSSMGGDWGEGEWEEEQGNWDAQTQTNVSDVTGVDCASCKALQSQLDDAMHIIKRLKRQMEKGGLRVDEADLQSPSAVSFLSTCRRTFSFLHRLSNFSRFLVSEHHLGEAEGGWYDDGKSQCNEYD
jgi:hypothetical protein